MKNKKAVGLKMEGGIVIIIVGITLLVISGGKIISLLSNPIMLILIFLVIFALKKN